MLRLPAAAAVFLVAGLVVAPLLGPRQDLAAPGSSPSAPAFAEPAVTGLPAELVGRWLSPPRAIEGLTLSESVALFDLSDGSFRTQLQSTSLASKPAPAGPDTFTLLSEGSSPGCPPGDVGTYRWSLSEDGRRLALETVADDCAVRAAYLAGE